MISNFTLKFGRTPGTSGEKIDVAPMTIFVGPNNSGKSRILSELSNFCKTGFFDQTYLLLENVTFSGFDADNAESALEQIRQPPNPDESLYADNIIVGSRYSRQHVNHANLVRAMQKPESNSMAFCQQFLVHHILFLDGQNRVKFVDQQGAGDLQRAPQTSLQVLFRDDIRRAQVRRIVADAFGKYFVIDPTNIGYLRVRLSDRPPVDNIEERGLHKEAVDFHAAAQPIEQTSDGVRAFTGIITEITAGDPRIFLIDEPEAFLHPSLAFKLGVEVSRAVASADKRVFVSTHSSMFVMGCIQAGVPVNIIRLTYRDSVATARHLPSFKVRELMRRPLLRSTGVLSGLFYECVIVTEGDSDRVFYQEVNERLIQFKSEWGIPNCLFLNAQNKQTIQTIIGPLRNLGIPAAAVVDIDVLNDGGKNWTDLLTSVHVPDRQQQSLAIARTDIKKAIASALAAEGLDMKDVKKYGLSILGLASGDYEAAQNLLSELAKYGLFVVPGGELESWLKSLGANVSKEKWLSEIFGLMGEDPEGSPYVKPADGDVWEFMLQLRSWLLDPVRKGIPV